MDDDDDGMWSDGNGGNGFVVARVRGVPYTVAARRNGAGVDNEGFTGEDDTRDSVGERAIAARTSGASV